MFLRSRTIAGFLAAFTMGVVWPAQALTFVFVHDKSAGRETVRSLRNNYWGQEMIDAVTRNGQAKSLVVSYDGRDYYWDAAVDVARQVTRFLNRNPGERLVWVAHSYGGLVTRFMLCNATPGSPYYNYRGANFSIINSATSHAITLGTPHGGSEVADLGTTLSNSIFTSWIVSLVDNNSNSAKVLTTAHLAYASQNWLSDSLRTKPVYTVAGTGTRNHVWHLNDVGLGIVQMAVPFRSATDGYVATWSAHATGAPGGAWLDIPANHDHLRHNDHPSFIGGIIGQFAWEPPVLPSDGLPGPPPDPPWADVGR